MLITISIILLISITISMIIKIYKGSAYVSMNSISMAFSPDLRLAERVCGT